MVVVRTIKPIKFSPWTFCTVVDKQALFALRTPNLATTELFTALLLFPSSDKALQRLR
jgi:hypothetical protein